MYMTYHVHIQVLSNIILVTKSGYMYNYNNKVWRIIVNGNKWNQNANISIQF